MDDDQKDTMAEGKNTLGESTPVKLSLVVAVIGLIVGATWWAASMNSTMSSMSDTLSQIRSELSKVSTERNANSFSIQNLTTRIEAMDKTGTAGLRELERSHRALAERVFILEQKLPK